jgi:hypothetical protein
VNVQSAGRRPQQAAEILSDHLVAGVGDERGRIDAGGMKARSEQMEPGVGYRAPQLGQVGQHLVGSVADPRLQLDLFGEDLRRDASSRGPLDPLQHRLARRDQPSAPVDQQQLLLDSERERRRAAELVVIAIGRRLSAHVQMPPRRFVFRGHDSE